MKKNKFISVLALMLLISNTFAISNYDIDNFWLKYINVSKTVYSVLISVRTANDLKKLKTKLEQSLKAQMSLFKNINQDDAPAIIKRYFYHLKNRTTMGANLININQLFYSEYKRVSQIPGGRELLKEIFPVPSNPAQAVNEHYRNQ